jgi:HD-GYP domain-containing protein (c-di-GMP phosphodiesterase class II)
MNILIAISHLKLQSMLRFALESQIRAKVETASTSAEAIKALIQATPFELIVTDHPIVAEPLIAFLTSMRSKIPVAIVLPRKDDIPKTYANLKNLEFFGDSEDGDLLRMLIDYAGLVRTGENDEEGETIPEADFCRVPAGLLNEQTKLAADIYIRLGESKYLKILPEGEIFSAADSRKYFVEKGVDFLYVKHAASAVLVDHFRQTLGKSLKDADKKPESVLNVAAEVHAATQDLIARVGLTAGVRALIKDNIMLTVKALASNPQLKGLLTKITTDKDSYIASHSVALAQLSCSLAVALGWGSETTIQKLTMASFLHDIVLTDQEIGKIQSKEEFSTAKKSYSPEEIKEYYLHPTRSAELATKFEEMPADIDSIISQHHERPDGSGFPRGLNKSQITPLSGLFIIAHDLMSAMQNHPDTFKLKEFFAEREALYNTGNFRKIFLALAKLSE